MIIIYTNFSKKSIIRWIVIIIEAKDKLFSCVGSYQKMFKTYELFSDHHYISYHISLENWRRKDLIKSVLESSFNMLIWKISFKTVAFLIKSLSFPIWNFWLYPNNLRGLILNAAIAKEVIIYDWKVGIFLFCG